MSITFKTANEIAAEIGQRTKHVRLNITWTQEELSRRTGVPVPTLKAFENRGKVSLETAIVIALALREAAGFEDLFPAPVKGDLEQIIRQPNLRKRGRRS